MMPYIEMALPIEEYAGPYVLLVEQNADGAFAWFAVLEELLDGSEGHWIPSPLPLPLQQDPYLYNYVFDEVAKMGFTLLVDESIVQH